MLKIKDLMCKVVVTAKEEISIQEAVQLLNDRHVGSIIIVDDEQKCRGIFTERDAIRLMANKFETNQPVGKIMSRHVVSVPFDASYDSAKQLMLTHDIRHLPVTDQSGKLVGVFCLRAFADEIMGIKTTLPNST